jgi:glycosyltransferase involved in cell wall biosynthesis
MTGSPGRHCILYDGWALRYDPTGPEALHLETLLRAAPQGERQVIALPGDISVSFSGAETLLRPTADTPFGRLVWEQQVLPNLFKRSRASLFHTTGSGVPIRLAGKTFVSPASQAGFPWTDAGGSARIGIWRRVRYSLAAGALAQVKAVLWPDDLPLPSVIHGARLQSLPPAAHPYFKSFPPGADGDRTDLPEAYVLYNGWIMPIILDRVLAAWSWASESIGETTPLVISGEGTPWMQSSAQQAGLQATVRFIQPESIHSLAVMYRGSTALLQTEESLPWGGPLRHALASGKPVAAVSAAWTRAIAGPAAYLTPQDDSRLLGAALLTLVVEEGVAEQMAAAARERSAGWEFGRFKEALGDLLR